MSHGIGRPALCILVSVFATACGGDGAPDPRERFGPFECVERTATAAPPTEVPPRLVRQGGEAEAEAEASGPLRTAALCPEGEVPRARPAVPNVPKGNPLIGPVEGEIELFFRDPAEQARRILGALRPLAEVSPMGHDGGEHAQLPDPPGCNGSPSFGSCFYYAQASFPGVADGGGMTLTVERPEYDGGGGPGHTLNEIAVQGGSANGDIVELGWNVSTSQYPDANPHLFVFHWIGWSPTCYDTCGWHQYSATYFPGMDLSTLVGLRVYVGYVYYRGNWWAWFDNQWLGYIEGAAWGGGYTSSNLIQWFGEVATANGIPPRTDMGNGLLPASGAAALDSTLCDVDAARWVCWIRDQHTWGHTFPTYYASDRAGFGVNAYGGPGE